jgi:hypothetical protein
MSKICYMNQNYKNELCYKKVNSIICFVQLYIVMYES